MTDEVVLYYNPQSRAQTIRWMLEEVGAPYRLEQISFDASGQKSPEFLALNPMGKIPTILHRGTVVTESAAIIAYLADAFPEAGLAPAVDSPERGTWYRWLFFGGSCFEPAMTDTMLKRPEVPKMSLGWGDFEDVLKTLKVALAPGPYLLGDKFSAADVYIGACLGWGRMFGAPGIGGEPVFDAYIERVQGRPAYQRATAQ
jgi:glutathione S-transferase